MNVPAAVTKRIRYIKSPDEASRSLARQRLDTLTKPRGSLGRLEDFAAQFAAIRCGQIHLPLSKAVYVFAADHGITAEGVSAYPSQVTHQMVLNFLAGGAAVSVLAKLHQVALHVVDVGVDATFENHPALSQRKVCRGTQNMLLQPAMTEAQVDLAMSVGAGIAADAAAAGHTLIAVGEMGIGNTTSASAITCALTGCTASLATGTGTGVDTNARMHKVKVVDAVLQRHFPGLQSAAPLDILRCVGGLEIAAMTGMILAAARCQLAIVIDGFISTAAAALAVTLGSKVHGYLFAGHRSEEPGHRVLLEHLQLTPILDLSMRLGEGSGAVLAMPILESAIALYTGMATFSSAGVSEAKA